jgi:hypothetical protein
VRTIWAIPAASLRSVLLGLRARPAWACRASRQITGSPSCRRVPKSQTASGPVSRPIRTSPGAWLRTKAAIARGQVGTLPSARVLPSSSTTQIAVVACDTSNPTKLRIPSSYWLGHGRRCRSPALQPAGITLSGVGVGRPGSRWRVGPLSFTRPRHPQPMGAGEKFGARRNEVFLMVRRLQTQAETRGGIIRRCGPCWRVLAPVCDVLAPGAWPSRNAAASSPVRPWGSRA